MTNLTPEQRAKIGRIKAAARALVDRMVDDLLECPDALPQVDCVRLFAGLSQHNEIPLLSWHSGRLDTPE